MSFHSQTVAVFCAAFIATSAQAAEPQKLILNEQEYFTTPGLDVLVFSNTYDGLFSDAKIAGIELIHHGVRTVTNGDVRLSPTPEQWDPVPALKQRLVKISRSTILTQLRYDAFDFDYAIEVESRDAGVFMRVRLDKPLPAALVGKAGFNLEFLPAAYFHRSYMTDRASGTLPLYPSGPTGRIANGDPERLPIAVGRKLVLAPEDEERRVTIE